MKRRPATPGRTTTGARWLWRSLVAAASLLCACFSGSGQPEWAVQGFYDAALRGDAAAAEAFLAGEEAQAAGELLRAATRAGELERAEIVSVDVWAEHGAVCEVRKSFAGGATEVVRIDLKRVAGDWKLAAGDPGY
jgi:hypothetical protein